MARRLVIARCDAKQIHFFDGRTVAWPDVSSIHTAGVFGSGVQLRLRCADALDAATPRGPLLAIRMAALLARTSPLNSRSDLVRAFWARNHGCGRSWVDMSVAGGALFAIGWKLDQELGSWGRQRGLLPQQESGPSEP